MISKDGHTSRGRGALQPGESQGIVVKDGGRGTERPGEPDPRPTIAAFIWGGKVRPSPTLPFGRWKGAA